MAGKYGKASDIRVGVIGYGGEFSMGKGHLKLVKKAGMTPAAVADLDECRLRVAESDFPGIKTYTSVNKMLKDSGVDLVILITPHNTHAKLALQCLRAGKQVVTEKPFSITTAEADKMIAEARKRKLMLSCYHNRHWDGCIIQALKTVRSGAIGEIFRIEAHMGGYGTPGDWWRSSKSISGGVLYDWGVHLLEYSLQLVDSPMKEVAGFSKTGFWANATRWKKDTTEDEGFAVVRFVNGAWVTLTITSIDSNPKHGQLEITGTKGSYIFSHRDWELIQPRAGAKTVITKGKSPPNHYEKYYANIAGHLVRGEKLVITPEWARRPIHILDLADKSARTGKAIKVKYS